MIEELIKKASSKSAKSVSKGSSVVISSRLRLARNLKDIPFLLFRNACERVLKKHTDMVEKVEFIYDIHSVYDKIALVDIQKNKAITKKMIE